MASRQLMRRTIAVQCILSCMLLAVGGRLAYVQTHQASDILRRVSEMRLQDRALQPLRGTIVDREGRVMAKSTWLPTIVANPSQIVDHQAAAFKLAPILNMKAEQVLGILKDPPSPGFAYIKKNATIEEANKVRDLGIEGIDIRQEAIRTYPQGAVASNLLGFVGGEGSGLEGLENYYEDELKGTPGQVIAEFTSGGVPIGETVRKKTDPVDGKTLKLTIDAALQMNVENFLRDYYKKIGAKRATIIAMEPNTGEILAMAIMPSFDINRLGDSTTDQRRAWPIVDVLSPGSIFKPITVASGLGSGAIHAGDRIPDPPSIMVQGVQLHDWEGDAPVSEPQTLSQLLARSSNTGLIQIGQRMGSKTFWEYLDKFGITKPTGIDFPGEAEPFFGGEPKDMQELDWANMYIGQKFLLTPLQVLRGIATIGNDGKIVRPHLVKEIRSADGATATQLDGGGGTQVVSPAVAADVRTFMEEVVKSGTGAAAQVPGFRVAGKTGTAQKFENGRMVERNTANFVGLVPADHPKVAMIVSIDEPPGDGLGGILAAPAFAKVLPEVMRTLGVAPDPNLMPKQQLKAPPKPPAPVAPNLTWLPVSSAMEKVVAAGFQVKMKGQGAVVSGQNPKPGTTMKSGDVIELETAAIETEQRIRIPNLMGMSLVEATDALSGLGLKAQVTGSGYVKTQAPAAGSLVAAGSTVALELSAP